MSGTKIIPTYFGYIGSTKDALLVIQSTLNKQLSPVPRRPHDRERSSLIQSGNVFVFVEEKSGIKRWTDGVAWSPSRILGRFLVYRELDKQALNDKEDNKMKKKKRKNSEDSQRNGASDAGQDPNMMSFNGNGQGNVPNRSLVGSLVASYAFKDQGLIKKTLSLTVNHSSIQSPSFSETIHLISYYNADDVVNGKFIRPSDSPQLKNLTLSSELWAAVKESSLGGKIPIEDEAYYFLDNNYQLQNMNMIPQVQQQVLSATGANGSFHPGGGYLGSSFPLQQPVSGQYQYLPPPMQTTPTGVTKHHSLGEYDFGGSVVPVSAFHHTNSFSGPAFNSQYQQNKRLKSDFSPTLVGVRQSSQISTSSLSSQPSTGTATSVGTQDTSQQSAANSPQQSTTQPPYSSTSYNPYQQQYFNNYTMMRNQSNASSQQSSIPGHAGQASNLPHISGGVEAAGNNNKWFGNNYENYMSGEFYGSTSR